MKKFVCIIIVFLLVGAIFGLIKIEKLKNCEILTFINDVTILQNNVIENVPIFDDYKDKDDAINRKYTYDKHMLIAQEKGIECKTKEQFFAYVKSRKFVSAESDKYYFYGVPKENRFLLKNTVSVLDELASNLQNKINSISQNAIFKIAVSSAFRYNDYQKNLRKKNANAISQSSHSYGVSVDIFFDDFFIAPKFNFKYVNKNLAQKLKRNYSFLLGDALRRQLKTLLSEELIKMQNEGKLIFIYEFKQCC